MHKLSDFRYYPRKDLVEMVGRVLHSNLTHAITMFAARRMGKTLFVRNELIPAAEAWRWRACYIDLWVRRDQPELGLVEELEAAFAPKGLVGRAMKPNKVKAKAGAAGSGVELQWEQAAAGDLQGRLRAAMRRLVEDGAEPVLLILDEFQTLAAGKHEDFVAAFRATMLELQPKLKIFFTGSSREALNAMFRKRKAPLLDAALSLTLPALGEDFVEDRAIIFSEMTGRETNVERLGQVFDHVARVPLYLNQIILHMVVGMTEDPWEGFRRWQQEMGETGLRDQLSKLKPADRIILEHLAHQRAESLFSNDFSAMITERLGDAKPYNPQRIQTAVNRLVKSQVLAPKGETGEYEIEDRALAIYLAAGAPAAK